MWKKLVDQHRPQTKKNDKCALHAGQLRLQIHTRNMLYLLIFHSNNCYTKVTQCYKYLLCLIYHTQAYSMELQIIWSHASITYADILFCLIQHSKGCTFYLGCTIILQHFLQKSC